MSESNKIVLNLAESKLAEYVAKERFKKNREKGNINKKVGAQSCKVTEIEGLAAEIAFCKLFNVYPDLETDLGTPDFDCILPTGEKIDVKGTTHPNGRLICEVSKISHPADLYALIVGTLPNYEFFGFATAEQLLNPDTITDLGYGPTYVLERCKLFFL